METCVWNFPSTKTSTHVSSLIARRYIWIHSCRTLNGLRGVKRFIAFFSKLCHFYSDCYHDLELSSTVCATLDLFTRVNCQPIWSSYSIHTWCNQKTINEYCISNAIIFCSGYRNRFACVEYSLKILYYPTTYNILKMYMHKKYHRWYKNPV